MRYLVYVFEQKYQGLHGIYEMYVEEYNNIEDLADDAREVSCNLMESYAGIMDELYEDTEELECDVDDLIDENIGFDYAVIRDDVTTQEVEDYFQVTDNYEEFVEKFCVKEY